MSILGSLEMQLWKMHLRRKYNAIKRNFRIDKCPHIQENGVHLFNDEIVSSFIYKDETWNYIKDIHEYLDSINRGVPIEYEDNSCESEKYQVADGKIIVNSRKKNDNWLCFYLRDMIPRQYMFRFRIKLFSEFTEVQLAFRYKNLGERHRFLLRDNRELAFESVHNGEFYHSLFSKPMRFSKEQEYEIKVYVLERHYALFINGQNFLCVTEKKQFS